MMKITRGLCALLFMVSYAPSLLAEPIRVSGRVLGANGSGLAKAQVELVSAGKSSPPLASARTAQDGTFEIAAPESGLYVLRVRSEGYKPEEISLTPLVEEREYPRLWLAPVREGADGLGGRTSPDGIRRKQTVVRSGPPRTITGKVVDSASRRPVSGGLVWSGSSLSRTEADGSFRLEVPGAQGAWIETAAAGYLAAPRSFIPEKSGPVTLTLDPAATLAGAVVDSAGRPVSGALVQPAPRPRRSLAGEGPVSTRSDGRFRLTGLAPRGTYRVSVAGRGIVHTVVTARTAAPGKPGPELRIVLPEGRTAFGRVEDESGRPVAGVSLLMYMAVSTRFDELAPEPSETVSDAAGRFEMRNLTPGQYSLHATRKGFSPADKPGIEIPRGPGETDLGALTLSAGAVLEGQVTDTRGTPLDKVEVRLFERQAVPDWQVVGPRRELQRVRTRPDGTFRIADLPRGKTYELKVRHPGYAEASSSPVLTPTSEPVRIELQAARTLSGRIVNSDGKPIGGATILRVEDPRLSLKEGGPSFSGGLLSEETSNPEGFFEIGGLVPGPVDLEVSAEGYKPKRLPPVQVPEDRDVQRIEVTLDRSAFVDVRVLDSAGNPVPGVWVRADPEPLVTPSSLLFSSALRSEEPSTDSEGRVRIEVPEPGTYRISTLGWGSRQSTSVEVPPDTTPRVELRLPETAQISGRVVGKDGWGISGAQIAFMSSEPDRQFEINAESDADGSFLSPPLESSIYQLRAAKPGFSQPGGPLSVEVAGRSFDGVEIRLAEEGPPGAISGRLLGLPPEEAARADIMATRDGHLPSFVAGRATAEGAYRIADLSPGLWTVRISTPSGRQAAGTVQLDPGVPEAVLDLNFTGFTLSGHVLMDGKPLAGAGILIASQGQHLQALDGTATTGDGSFTVRNLRSGIYVLAVELEGAFRDSRIVEVTEDRTIRIDLQAEAPPE